MESIPYTVFTNSFLTRNTNLSIIMSKQILEWLININKQDTDLKVNTFRKIHPSLDKIQLKCRFNYIHSGQSPNAHAGYNYSRRIGKKQVKGQECKDRSTWITTGLDKQEENAPYATAKTIMRVETLEDMQPSI